MEKIEYYKFQEITGLLKFLAHQEVDKTTIGKLCETVVLFDAEKKFYLKPDLIEKKIMDIQLSLYKGEKATLSPEESRRLQSEKLKTYVRGMTPGKAGNRGHEPAKEHLLPGRILVQTMIEEVFKAIKENLPDLDDEGIKTLVSSIIPVAKETRDRLLKQYLVRIRKKDIHQELEFLWKSGHSRIRGTYAADTRNGTGQWLLLLDNLKVSLTQLAWEEADVFYYLGGNNDYEVYLEAGYEFPDSWWYWLSSAGSETNWRILLVSGTNQRDHYPVSTRDFKPVLHFGDLKFIGGKDEPGHFKCPKEIPAVPITFELKPENPSERQSIERRLEILTREINFFEHELETWQPFQIAGKDSPMVLKIFDEHDGFFRNFVRDASSAFLRLCRHYFFRIGSGQTGPGFHILMPDIPKIFGAGAGDNEADYLMGWCMGGTTLYAEPTWYKAGIFVFIRGNLGIWPPLHLSMDKSDTEKYTPLLFAEAERKEILKNHGNWATTANRHLFILWDGFEPAQTYSKTLQCIRIQRDQMPLMSEESAIKRENSRMIALQFTPHAPSDYYGIEKSLDNQRVGAFEKARQKLAEEAENDRKLISNEWEALKGQVGDSNNKIKDIKEKRRSLQAELEKLERRLNPDLREKIKVIAELSHIPTKDLQDFLSTYQSRQMQRFAFWK